MIPTEKPFPLVVPHSPLKSLANTQPETPALRCGVKSPAVTYIPRSTQPLAAFEGQQERLLKGAVVCSSQPAGCGIRIISDGIQRDI